MVHHGPEGERQHGFTGVVPLGRSGQQKLDVGAWEGQDGHGGPHRWQEWTAEGQRWLGDEEWRQ
jgi:hypothetical protein